MKRTKISHSTGVKLAKGKVTLLTFKPRQDGFLEFFELCGQRYRCERVVTVKPNTVNFGMRHPRFSEYSMNCDTDLETDFLPSLPVISCTIPHLPHFTPSTQLRTFVLCIFFTVKRCNALEPFVRRTLDLFATVCINTCLSKTKLRPCTWRGP
ncbi:hypothetical protein RvY_07219-2 [Ramazzottius varieornatus]|uniref:Uncharacterized protein n=1 Tax=Ramazzottius varieornatus TaxID=947166 RepID=A0A1D1V9V2_RAMVA|nr:hypothetical protein RvY_07219-2 [Ramazzottius varieornatus]